MKREEIIEAILNHVTRLREDGCDCAYFGALALDDDTTTLGDLIDKLPASAPAEPDESLRNAGNKLYDLLNSKGLAALEQWDDVA